MGREQVLRILTMICVVMAGVFGAFALLLFVGAAIATDGMALTAAFIVSLLGVGAGIGAWFLTRPDQVVNGVSSIAEKELLNHKQRRELRKARGEVVMEKALIDVEHERQNIVHRQLEAANDPDKPPHQTSFTSPEEEWRRAIEEGRK